MAEGLCKKRLFQIISVTTQVPISRRVSRYRLALRVHQAARGRKKGRKKQEDCGQWSGVRMLVRIIRVD